MAMKVYIGSADEITARLAGAPSSTTTTVASATSKSAFALTSATSFSAGDSITINRQKAVIDTITGVNVTLTADLDAIPTAGDTVAHYDADYTIFRDMKRPFTFVNDLKTGGSTGDPFGQQELIVSDHKGTMPRPVEGNRITIFDSVDPTTPLFAGVIVFSRRVRMGKKGALVNNTPVNSYAIRAVGFAWEADSVGIEEEPQFNVNAGKFLRTLMQNYTTLEEGEIDVTNSPTIDVIRLANYRRFSDVGQELAARWAGSEFYIDNDHTNGKVYFRQAATTYAPFTLSEDFVDEKTPEQVEIIKDYTKTFNIVRLPFYLEQEREPDFFVQSTVADDAFLKTSVLLSGEPSNLEQTDLILLDFADEALPDGLVEDDRTNASPPDGHVGSEGFLVRGDINDVTGLHFLDTSALSSPAASFGDMAIQTDPTVSEPFTGKENQTVYCKELVISTLGDAIIGGIIDQTTYSTTAASGSTTSRVYCASVADFAQNDRVTIGADSPYITAVGADYIDVSPALSGAPATGATVTLHRSALSRIKFGILLKASGDLKYILNGVETAFPTPRTYTASPTTYSFRWVMRSFETTIDSGASATGATLVDATHFATGDVVDIFTQGGRNAPERRVITKAGSAITFAETDHPPAVGYRVRTHPKIVLEVKGGAFGDINGRDWTEILESTNTWQTSATTDVADHGILVAMQKSLRGTLTLFQMKDPPALTANIGSRFLHIGTQDVDTAEPDIDCIVQKINSRTQLAFFPDSKALWASGSTLSIRYKEKFETHLEEYDLDSIREVAKTRGFTLTGTESIAELIRKGGRALDTIQLLPNTLTLEEASNQIRAILDAIKDLAITVVIRTNSFLDSLASPGQTLLSTIPGISNLRIERVEIAEIPGAKNPGTQAAADTGKQVFFQVITAGTIDRLSDVLLKREQKSGSRLVIDDGSRDDTFTKLSKINLAETITPSDTFDTYTCDGPTEIIYDGASYALLRCVILPVTGTGGGPLFDDADQSAWLGIV
jgi:hypothetical protein